MHTLSPFTRSRPRFWLYLFGPFLLGVLAGPTGWHMITNPLVLAFAVFFTFPANYWIYMVNDLADYDTDRLNPKKQGYEHLLHPSLHTRAWTLGITLIAPFILLTALSINLWWSIVGIVGFLFFGSFYSLPPVRAKVRPIIDSIFNILYVFPAIIGYSLVSTSAPDWRYLAAGAAWCMAMHAFSAIPDITADTRAGLRTVATTLGTFGTLLFCALLYLTASALVSTLPLGAVTTALGSCYVAVMVLAVVARNSPERLFSLYKAFPLINTLAGAVLTFSVLALRP